MFGLGEKEMLTVLSCRGRWRRGGTHTEIEAGTAESANHDTTKDLNTSQLVVAVSPGRRAPPGAKMRAGWPEGIMTHDEFGVATSLLPELRLGLRQATDRRGEEPASHVGSHSCRRRGGDQMGWWWMGGKVV